MEPTYETQGLEQNSDIEFDEDIANFVTKKVEERSGGGKKILFHPQYKDSTSGGIAGKLTPESRRQYFDESYQPKFIPAFKKFLTSKFFDFFKFLTIMKTEANFLWGVLIR